MYCLGIHSYNLRLWLLFVAAVDNGDNCLCQIDEGKACGRLAAQGCWGAGIAIVADTLYEWYLSQQWNLHLFSEALATLLSKDIVFFLW